MKLFLFPIIILVYFYYGFTEDIIIFPDNVDSYKIITKYGPINVEKTSYNTEKTKTNLINFSLIGIKNLSLYNPPKIKGISIDIIEDVIQFTIDDSNINKLNPLLCELFYQTHYIKKKIYSVENNARNKPYKYFGGTPNEIIENLNKFEFKNYQEIPTFYLLRGQEGEKEENMETIIFNPLDRLEFNESFEKNCAKTLLEEWDYLFWKFDIIKYRFEDKAQDIAIIFKNKKSEEKQKGTFEDLFYEYPCDNLVLGSKFLDLINVREFNLETGVVTLFVDKDNEIIKNSFS